MSTRWPSSMIKSIFITVPHLPSRQTLGNAINVIIAILLASTSLHREQILRSRSKNNFFVRV